MAIFLAVILGYGWMGEGGAAAFALAGLWGCYGAVRPWRMERGAMIAVVALATLAPALLWLAGVLHPDFAEGVYGALAPVFDHVQGLALVDDSIRRALAGGGRMSELPVIRMGVGACWLCALPAAAAIVLWYGGKPEDGPRHVGGHGDPAEVLGAGLGAFVLTSALLVTGVGFDGGRRSLVTTFGVIGYPALFLLWLVAIVALRAWANWWLALGRAGGVKP